jgi:aminoglycoside 3-N-acetyltransferase
MFAERLENYFRPTYRAIRRRVARWDRVLDRRTMTTTEFQELLNGLGITEGAVVLVHSSMDAVARRVPGLSPTTLIQILQHTVTEQGTLLMPTFPFTGRQAHYVDRTNRFDVRRTPSQSGLITEIFRRMPDVVRSLHPTHSVAAWGKYAADLTQSHHLGGAFGANSPICRLRDYGGMVVGLGTGLRDSFTILHVVEEVHPKARDHFFERETRSMTIIDADGRERDYTFRVLRAGVRRDYERVERVLIDEGVLRYVAARGLRCAVTRAQSFIDRAMQLVDEDRYL